MKTRHIFLFIFCVILSYGYAQKHSLVLGEGVSYSKTAHRTNAFFPNLALNPSLTVRSSLGERFWLEYGFGIRQYNFEKGRVGVMLSDGSIWKPTVGITIKSMSIPLSLLYRPIPQVPLLVSGNLSLQKLWYMEDRFLRDNANNPAESIIIQKSYFDNRARNYDLTMGVGSEYVFKTHQGSPAIGINYEWFPPIGPPGTVSMHAFMLYAKYLIRLKE